MKLIPAKLSSRPEESIQEPEPTSHDRIVLFPIRVDVWRYWSADPVTTTMTVLESERLTIEDVSSMIAKDAFLVWKAECFLSKDVVEDLEQINYAIVHRYTTTADRETEADRRAAHLIDMTVACLSVIRPTRLTHAGRITGIEKDGKLSPQFFESYPQVVDIPPVQKLFFIENKHVETLREVLPEFIRLFDVDSRGKPKIWCDPIQMALQLYRQAYSIDHTNWKARHILWWAAIESLYGSDKTDTKARIFGLFGNKDLLKGFHSSMYEDGDVSARWEPLTAENNHTLGGTLEHLYDVRDTSAHGQRVGDSYFAEVPHPTEGMVPLRNVLAECATLIIRKTLLEILKGKLCEKFKNQKAREVFWLEQYGLGAKQCEKRLVQELGALHKPRKKRG